MAETQPAVLITGASSGFGRETARIMAGRGWRVFGTSRRETASDIDGCRMLVLDVCSDDSVSRCVQQVIDSAGRIDVLVNNAGFVLNGFAEEVTLEQARALFETDFFGVVRMTNAVLGIMRDQGGGRIINISSMLGLLGIPYRSCYTAAKFALEGYSESLSYELAGFNIKVSIVEPGFFRTGLDDAMVKASNTLPAYEAVRSRLDAHFERSRHDGGDPEQVGRLIAHVAGVKSPRLRYRIGPYSRWLTWVRRLLPERLYAIGVRRHFGLQS